MPFLTRQPQKGFTDTYGRTITYARIALTDRCNLRCSYCMPQEGLPVVSKPSLLTYEEWYRLIGILIDHGISKIRITGGEPFVRKNSLDFITSLKKRFPGLKSLHITSNGVGLAPKLEALKTGGVDGLNISLDALNPVLFKSITRRDLFKPVMESINLALALGFRVKINTVVIKGVNDGELASFCDWAAEKPLDIRFIEQMPFNGSGENRTFLSAWEIRSRLRRHVPALNPAPGSATAEMYTVPGYRGRLGIIAAYTRTFCGRCNRIRITPDGGIQTCLYAAESLNVRDLLRGTEDDAHVVRELRRVINQKARDGFEAEALNSYPLASMAQIGG